MDGFLPRFQRSAHLSAVLASSLHPRSLTQIICWFCCPEVSPCRVLHAGAFLPGRFPPAQTQSLRPSGDAIFNASPTAHPLTQPYSLRPFCKLSHFFCGMNTTTPFRAGRGAHSEPRTVSCRSHVHPHEQPRSAGNRFIPDAAHELPGTPSSRLDSPGTSKHQAKIQLYFPPWR